MFVENVQKWQVRQGMVTNPPKGHVSMQVNVVEMMEVVSAEQHLVHMLTGMGQLNYRVQIRHRHAKPMELVNARRQVVRQEMETGHLKEAVEQGRFVIQTESVLKVA